MSFNEDERTMLDPTTQHIKQGRKNHNSSSCLPLFLLKIFGCGCVVANSSNRRELSSSTSSSTDNVTTATSPTKSSDLRLMSKDYTESGSVALDLDATDDIDQKYSGNNGTPMKVEMLEALSDSSPLGTAL